MTCRIGSAPAEAKVLPSLPPIFSHRQTIRWGIRSPSMATSETTDSPAGGFAQFRRSLSHADKRSLFGMYGFIIALHLIGFGVLFAFVVPEHNLQNRVDRKPLSVSAGAGRRYRSAHRETVGSRFSG